MGGAGCGGAGPGSARGTGRDGETGARQTGAAAMRPVMLLLLFPLAAALSGKGGQRAPLPGRPRGPELYPAAAARVRRAEPRRLSAGPGRFWHVTDLHWDPEYDAAASGGQVCPSGGSRAVPAAGPWGSYLCDAPWRLLVSAARAMKSRLQRPDFVLWTG